MSQTLDRARPLSFHNLHVWAFQLQIMLAAGLPLLLALKSIARSELPVLADISEPLSRKIAEGQPLSQAMRSMGPTFSPFDTNLVVVGEESGKLAQVLERLSERASRRAKTQRALVNALAYPVFLALVSIGMAFCMAFYMFPRLLPFLMGLGVSLPWPTRALVWLTDNFSLLLLALILVLAYAGRMLTSDPNPRTGRFRSWLIYHSPLLGPLNTDRVYADTLDDLHLMVEARCELVKGLKTLQVPWPEFQERIGTCIEMVSSGDTFSDAVRRSGVLPARFAMQIKSGEETGQMARMFRLISEQLHESVSLRVHQIVQILEPTILLGMGVVTGFVVVATFLPLYSMATTAL